MIELTPNQFQTIRLTLTQIVSLASAQEMREIESLAEAALAELRHGALDSDQPEAIGLEQSDSSEIE